MAKITKFEFKNFKGIEKTELILEGKNSASASVITVIGLNESGKSTLLEAISHFVTGDKFVASLFNDPYVKTSAVSLIPLHKKAAFTGAIEITATISIESNDLKNLQRVAEEKNYELDLQSINSTLTVTSEYKFADSAIKGNRSNLWAFFPKAKKGKSRSYKEVSSKDEDGLWKALVGCIERSLEQIVYFPTFLVDLPNRIYLKEHEGETAINKYYRHILQDVLDSLGEDLSLDRHVCDRVDKFKEENAGDIAAGVWLSKFLGSDKKALIDSVFHKISHAISREVLGSWRKIFQRNISANSILVEWNVDVDKSDIPYASLYVLDGVSRYAINERSLGFRWFFSFLLFSGFKQNKERKTIFVFDEPAANLHAKAQAELLKSFSRIANNGNKIIYTTHSHHMINPKWLNSAYIVENSALDYDADDSFGFTTKPTKIEAIPYRRFVSDYPSRSSYFQPVVEKLEYVVPEIVGNGPYVIVEGISDYYAFRLVMETLNKRLNFSLLPGVGSGASGPIISQLIGRGQRFIVLLDDDKEGKAAASKYKEDWLLRDDTVCTMVDFDEKFKGKALEKVLGANTELIIKEKFGLTKKPSKKQIGWCLAEAFAISDKSCISKEAYEDIAMILNRIEEKLARFDH